MKSKESPLKRINRVIAGIYKITSPDGKIYIGQSVNLKRRMRSYFIKSNAINHRRLKESLSKFGKENHVFEIVLECQEYELDEKERYYQDYYDCIGVNGLNCVLTKTESKKQVFSDCTLKIMSDSRMGDKNPMFGKTGNKNPFFGKKHSEETKTKISEKNSGEKHCFYGKKRPEHSLKMSGSNHVNFGKKCQRTSDMNKLRVGLNHPTLKVLLDLNTGVFYYGIKDYSDIHGIKKETVRYKIRTGKLKNIQTL